MTLNGMAANMLRTKLKEAGIPRPRGITALSIFFVAGAMVSLISDSESESARLLVNELITEGDRQRLKSS